MWGSAMNAKRETLTFERGCPVSASTTRMLEVRHVAQPVVKQARSDNANKLLDIPTLTAGSYRSIVSSSGVMWRAMRWLACWSIM